MLAAVTWISFLLFVHTWALYPVLMWALSRGRRCLVPWDGERGEELPGVSAVLPVRNGQAALEEKVNDLLALDYPGDRFEIIIVSDGSTDDTVEIGYELARLHPGIVVLALPESVGKSAAQNYGAREARHPILLFTDVDAKMTSDSLQKMVAWFRGREVGCVGTNVKYRKSDWEVSGAQGIYWRTEEMLRKAESELGVLISVCGSAIAVRSEYFVELEPDTGDDFIIPLNMALRGYRTVFAEDAIVIDDWPARGFHSELKVRRRITNRNLLGLSRRIVLLNPISKPLLSFSLISHKVLRWLSPVFMILMIIGSGILGLDSHMYRLGLFLQLTLYMLAGLGLEAPARSLAIPILGQLGAFLWTNIGVLAGVLSLVLGKRIGAYRN